jgi:2,4-dienoyl-CoA reductase-like NADH-dependent reductase (Old Yellow Enzyme family)/thioredoxin reductase
VTPFAETELRLSTDTYPLLFSPIRLGHVEARNRIVSTSHGTNMAANGAPSAREIAYHAAKAQGGCGTVMMFGSAAASPLTPMSPDHVNLYDDGALPGLREAAAAVKAHGALAISQVTSYGRRSRATIDQTGYGPSDTVSEIAPSVPHVLSLGEIRQMIEHYADACRRLKACDFDGCDLAFYDDQLPDQFWNPFINRRQDAYGGSLDNRLRFSLEVLEAVRAAVGRDFIVGARVSGDDHDRGGLDPDELLDIIGRLDRTGTLDYFTVTGGTISTYRSRGYNIPSAYFPPATFTGLSRRIRSAIQTTVIVTGRIVTPEQAETVLREGSADLVGMTRALIADPELPNKAREGLLDDIRVCMGSNEGCIDRLYFGLPIQCVQNPVVGREREWGTLTPAARSRRVLVVGGGPAGMEAARVAALRGHEVTLVEHANELGGAILIACRAPGWEAYRGSVDWLEGQLRKLPVEIRTSHEASVASVLAEQPEVVIVATGAEPRRPQIPGADRPHVVTAAEVLADQAKVGPRCVILDETGYTPGPKVADALSLAGHQVEIVTPQYSLGEDIGTTLRAVLVERLLRHGVTITVLTAPVAISPEGVTVTNVLTGAVRELPADTVIVSSSGVGRDALYHALRAQVEEQGASMELHMIGDAFAPRQLRHATEDGARVGREI